MLCHFISLKLSEYLQVAYYNNVSMHYRPQNAPAFRYADLNNDQEVYVK